MSDESLVLCFQICEIHIVIQWPLFRVEDLLLDLAILDVQYSIRIYFDIRVVSGHDHSNWLPVVLLVAQIVELEK
jgi:hypothetical protein